MKFHENFITSYLPHVTLRWYFVVPGYFIFVVSHMTEKQVFRLIQKSKHGAKPSKQSSSVRDIILIVVSGHSYRRIITIIIITIRISTINLMGVFQFHSLNSGTIFEVLMCYSYLYGNIGKKLESLVRSIDI